jgi:hypothetical protein
MYTVLRLYKYFRTGAAIYLMASVRNNILDRPMYFLPHDTLQVITIVTYLAICNTDYKARHLGFRRAQN